MKIFLGIDFGTSGCRAVVIDLEENIHLETAINFSESFASNWINTWKQSLFKLFANSFFSKYNIILVDLTWKDS
jgi:sugar (pentulose or hexulose) kinase